MRVLMMDLRHAWRMSLRQPVATLSIIAWDTTAIDATASPEGFDMPGIAHVAGRRFTENEQ